MLCLEESDYVFTKTDGKTPDLNYNFSANIGTYTFPSCTPAECSLGKPCFPYNASNKGVAIKFWGQQPPSGGTVIPKASCTDPLRNKSCTQKFCHYLDTSEPNLNCSQSCGVLGTGQPEWHLRYLDANGKPQELNESVTDEGYWQKAYVAVDFTHQVVKDNWYRCDDDAPRRLSLEFFCNKDAGVDPLKIAQTTVSAIQESLCHTRLQFNTSSICVPLVQGCPPGYEPFEWDPDHPGSSIGCQSLSGGIGWFGTLVIIILVVCAAYGLFIFRHVIQNKMDNLISGNLSSGPNFSRIPTSGQATSKSALNQSYQSYSGGTSI
eukprot:g3141.t1